MKRLNEATVKALAAPEVKDKLEATGITVASSTPAAFSQMINTEIGRWRTVINDAKVTTE